MDRVNKRRNSLRHNDLHGTRYRDRRWTTRISIQMWQLYDKKYRVNKMYQVTLGVTRRGSRCTAYRDNCNEMHDSRQRPRQAPHRYVAREDSTSEISAKSKTAPLLRARRSIIELVVIVGGRVSACKTPALGALAGRPGAPGEESRAVIWSYALLTTLDGAIRLVHGHGRNVRRRLEWAHILTCSRARDLGSIISR